MWVSLALMDSISKLLPLPVIAPKPKLVPDRRLGERRSKESDPGRRSRERRASPRVQVELDCEERCGSSRYFRITTDLSTFGLATRQGYRHRVGTRLELLLYLPDGEPPLSLSAEVVGAYDERGGMRLAFRNPSREAVRRIHRFLLRVGVQDGR